MDQAFTGLALGDRAPERRPYVVLNMVSTADGKAAVDGRTAPMGSDVDRAVFHRLRTQADAVMVGASTVRIERYGRMTKTNELRDARLAEGLQPDALAVVVSGSLDLAPDLPLLADPESRVVVVTASAAQLDGAAAQVSYIREPAQDGGGVSLAGPLERLRSEHGVRSLLCEGGAQLNSQLLREGLVDELFLTFAPKLVGGAHALTIVAGRELPEMVDLELMSALRAGSELFLRYRVVNNPAP